MSPVELSYFNVVQKTVKKKKKKECVSCVMSVSTKTLGELSIVFRCNRPKCRRWMEQQH